MPAVQHAATFCHLGAYTCPCCYAGAAGFFDRCLYCCSRRSSCPLSPPAFPLTRLHGCPQAMAEEVGASTPLLGGGSGAACGLRKRGAAADTGSVDKQSAAASVATLLLTLPALLGSCCWPVLLVSGTRRTDKRMGALRQAFFGRMRSMGSKGWLVWGYGFTGARTDVAACPQQGLLGTVLCKLWSDEKNERC
eukprot:365832-Chlamydomonas_euryale.AAC.2